MAVCDGYLGLRAAVMSSAWSRRAVTPANSGFGSASAKVPHSQSLNSFSLTYNFLGWFGRENKMKRSLGLDLCGFEYVDLGLDHYISLYY